MGLVDLAPTILSLAGAESPTGSQGRDLSELFLGRDPVSGLPVGRVATAVKNNPHLYAVRTERYKLIADLESGSRRLFDVIEDPAEYKNLRKSRPDVLRDLEVVLQTHLESVVQRGRLKAETSPVSPETRDELRALGYLD